MPLFLGYPNPDCGCGCVATGPTCHGCTLPASVVVTLKYYTASSGGTAQTTVAVPVSLSGAGPTWVSGYVAFNNSQYVVSVSGSTTSNGLVQVTITCFGVTFGVSLQFKNVPGAAVTFDSGGGTIVTPDSFTCSPFNAVTGDGTATLVTCTTPGDCGFVSQITTTG